MTIRFERAEKGSRYLDPRDGFRETRVVSERRRDPLTGRTARIAHFVGFALPPVDLAPDIETSRAACPFCPDRIDEVTPRFPSDLVPEGRVRRGESVVFPNLSPYDEHSAVVVITSEHHVPMGAFSPEQVADWLSACVGYFRAVRGSAGSDYAVVSWNYMPPSAASQIHPHGHAFVTDTPWNAHREELDASLGYLEREGRPFWRDLLEEEERLGERFVARGRHTAWVTPFVSRSPLSDVLAVFPDRTCLEDLPDAAMREFAVGLTQVLRRLEERGVYSFNVGWFAGTQGRDDFWLHARLSPRLWIHPVTRGSDTAFIQHLYDEPFMVQTPEELAEALRGAVDL